MRYEREVVDQRDGSDHQIYTWNGDPLAKQGPTGFTELLGANVIEVEHVHVFQEIFDSLKKVGWIADVVGSGVKFSEDDGRDK
jgi:hypothetical protein